MKIINKQNLHTHTSYADGKDAPEEIILKAIQKGFNSIGFSEHSYMSFSNYPYQMTVEQTDEYIKEIHFLKSKYQGIIDVFCGMEYDFFSNQPTDDFDYLIGSVHYLDFDGKILGFDRGLNETTCYINENFGGNGLIFAKKYYSTVARICEKKQFDIIGHFDLITKNNQKGNFIDTNSKEYLNLGYEAIHALKGKIPFFEVNTGAISRGYRNSAYPQLEFLKEFKNCGFGAVITSDCHDKEYLDCFFEESKKLLEKAGFTSRWVLKDSGFTEVAL